MKRVLVVFYSYTGTSRRLAQLLCAQLNWQSGEITELRSRAGTSGSLRCVADSLLRRHPAVIYSGPDPESFDLVVLVSPIWMYRLAAPMRAFVSRWGKQLAHTAVVSVMGGKGGANAAAEIGRILGHAPALSISVTAREVEDGSCAGRLSTFGHALEADAGGEAVRPSTWSPRPE